jgi:uncharacterized protein (TIGR00266 family)
MSTTARGLEYRIESQPDYGFLTVRIPRGETIRVEAGAMATMDTSIRMKTRVRGGLKRMMTGESLFINEFSAPRADGEIGIAPGCPGDLAHVYLDGESVFLQSSAFVAAAKTVTVDTKWQGMTKGFFSGESFFLIRCSGIGDLWFNTFGAMLEVDVTDGYVVDTGYIVGFTEGLEYRVQRVGGLKSFFLSGEGLVCRFTGAGKIWIQTRQAAPFVGWADFFRPVKTETDSSND